MNSPVLCNTVGPHFLIFSSNVPQLVYYAHIPVMIFSLILGIFILLKDRKNPTNISLFCTTFFFSIWVLFDSIFWAANRSDMIMFVWAGTILVEPLVYASAFYLVYSKFQKANLSFRAKLAFALFYGPIIIFLPTTYTLKGFDLASCLSVEGFFAFYVYPVEIFLTLSILYVGYRAYRSAKDREKRMEVFYFILGIFIFLLMFASGNIIGSFTDNWQIGQLGLLGMPIMIGLISYVIVKYKTFNIKLLGVQALVVGLWGLVFAILFLDENVSVRIITCVTLILATILGSNVVRSVKKEIKSREKIEELAKTLESTNEELASTNIRLKELDQQKSEFVSLASHQLRSPLTAIRGYTSLILEGEFGAIPPAAKEPIEKIYSSVHSLVIMVEDFLNVTRIEQGRMKFDFTDFDLAKLVEDVIYEQKPTFEKAGLAVSFAAEPGKKYPVNADLVKIKQVVTNFLDNSIKYTPKGSVSVAMKKDAYNKILISIKDTGVGISAETLPKLFNKFTRANDANKTNVQGTGLGLYVAKQMVEAHKGRVWAESAGEGKGSSFFIELQGK